MILSLLWWYRLRFHSRRKNSFPVAVNHNFVSGLINWYKNGSKKFEVYHFLNPWTDKNRHFISIRIRFIYIKLGIFAFLLRHYPYPAFFITVDYFINIQHINIEYCTGNDQFFWRTNQFLFRKNISASHIYSIDIRWRNAFMSWMILLRTIQHSNIPPELNWIEAIKTVKLLSRYLKPIPISLQHYSLFPSINVWSA